MKDGVIIKSNTGFDYYKGPSDKTLAPLPRIPRGSIKTLKSQHKGSVTIENKYISVTLHDDGGIDITPHSQIRDSVEGGE